MIEMTRQVVRHRFGPTPGLVMPTGSAQGPMPAKLLVPERDPSLHLGTPLFQQRLLGGGVLRHPCRATRRRHCDAAGLQRRSLGHTRPVGIVAEEMPPEGGLHQGVEALDVVTVARDLQDKRDASAGGENQVLADALKPAPDGRAVSALDEAPEALLASGPYGATNVDGVRVDDEKGGFPSPSRAQRA